MCVCGPFSISAAHLLKLKNASSPFCLLPMHNADNDDNVCRHASTLHASPLKLRVLRPEATCFYELSAALGKMADFIGRARPHQNASLCIHCGLLIYGDHSCKSPALYADVARKLLLCRHNSESCIDTVVSCVIGSTGSVMGL